MFNIVKKEINWNGDLLSIETGKIARQSDGAVLVTYGNTSVLCTVVFDKKPSDEVDFFPLGVHYIEKPYAAGKFPGGFSKREGKPSDREVLVGRLIDRSLRPLFHKDFRNETQIICQVLSYDPDFAPEIPTIIGTSAALTISGIPFLGPVASCRVGLNKLGEFYPIKKQTDENSLTDLFVSGTSEGILMVESESSEVPEHKVLDAIWYAHENYQPVIKMIIDFAEEAAKEPFSVEERDEHYYNLYNEIMTACVPGIREAFKIKEKLARYAAADKVLEDFLKNSQSEDEALVKSIFKTIEREILKQEILVNKKRIDGRGPNDIRPIVAEHGLFKMVHGSGMFTRGETQVMSFLTLGSYQDEQVSETLEHDFRESFYLHYNFPPYCVGEATKLGPISRREIGHGKLAFKALKSVIPNKNDFPYTVRLVAEVTESNGSSSMATVCASSLALMDGGVPVKSHVAGIAMGLIKGENDDFVILTDIMGDEDHLGDMDLKVTGTHNGITALQMDIKTTNISKDIIKDAISKARIAINKILKILEEAIPAPSSSVTGSAPQMKVIRIQEKSIPDLIGPGGKVIREITDKTGAKIDVSDNGEVKIFAKNADTLNNVLELIKLAVVGPDEGSVFQGTVVKIISSGAFVRIMDNKEGFLHISEMAEGRVNEVTDVLSEGDKVRVMVIGGGRGGRIRLTMNVDTYYENLKKKQSKAASDRKNENNLNDDSSVLGSDLEVAADSDVDLQNSINDADFSNQNNNKKNDDSSIE